MLKLSDYAYGATYATHELYSTRASYMRECNKELIEMLWPDNDCPRYVIDSIDDADSDIDIVLENLNTHDWTKLKKFIEKEYDVSVYKANDNHDKKDAVVIDSKFKQCLEFYNYYFTQFAKNCPNKILVDPLYSEMVRVSTSLPNHAQAYHVTTREKGNSILRSGLRPKTSPYRYFPSRVYLMLPNEYSGAREAIREVIASKGYKKDDVCVLKVDLHKVEGYNFYKDVAMKSRDEKSYMYIYTYAKIPNEYIRDVTKKLV